MRACECTCVCECVCVRVYVCVRAACACARCACVVIIIVISTHGTHSFSFARQATGPNFPKGLINKMLANNYPKLVTLQILKKITMISVSRPFPMPAT